MSLSRTTGPVSRRLHGGRHQPDISTPGRAECCRGNGSPGLIARRAGPVVRGAVRGKGRESTRSRACALRVVSRRASQVGPGRRGAGSMPLALRISHTVDAATFTPSPANSPWILRYPQLGFSRASRRTRALMCLRVVGRSCRAWTWRPSGGGRCPGASARWCPG